MFDFTFNVSDEAMSKILIFESDNDVESIKKSEPILKEFGVATREFHNYGHFTYGAMETEEFPELLQEILA